MTETPDPDESVDALPGAPAAASGPEQSGAADVAAAQLDSAASSAASHVGSVFAQF